MATRRCLGTPDHRCTRLVTGRPRCPDCTRTLEARRGTRQQRGYDADHDAARRALAATLPAPCGYGCGTTLTPDHPWVAAHRVDGHPQHGWLASCVRCNERAKTSRRR